MKNHLLILFAFATCLYVLPAQAQTEEPTEQETVDWILSKLKAYEFHILPFPKYFEINPFLRKNGFCLSLEKVTLKALAS